MSDAMTAEELDAAQWRIREYFGGDLTDLRIRDRFRSFARYRLSTDESQRTDDIVLGQEMAALQETAQRFFKDRHRVQRNVVAIDLERDLETAAKRHAAGQVEDEFSQDKFGFSLDSRKIHVAGLQQSIVDYVLFSLAVLACEIGAVDAVGSSETRNDRSLLSKYGVRPSLAFQKKLTKLLPERFRPDSDPAVLLPLTDRGDISSNNRRDEEHETAFWYEEWIGRYDREVARLLSEVREAVVFRFEDRPDYNMVDRVSVEMGNRTVLGLVQLGSDEIRAVNLSSPMNFSTHCIDLARNLGGAFLSSDFKTGTRAFEKAVALARSHFESGQLTRFLGKVSWMVAGPSDPLLGKLPFSDCITPVMDELSTLVPRFLRFYVKAHVTRTAPRNDNYIICVHPGRAARETLFNSEPPKFPVNSVDCGIWSCERVHEVLTHTWNDSLSNAELREQLYLRYRNGGGSFRVAAFRDELGAPIHPALSPVLRPDTMTVEISSTRFYGILLALRSFENRLTSDFNWHLINRQLLKQLLLPPGVNSQQQDDQVEQYRKTAAHRSRNLERVSHEFLSRLLMRPLNFIGPDSSRYEWHFETALRTDLVVVPLEMYRVNILELETILALPHTQRTEDTGQQLRTVLASMRAAVRELAAVKGPRGQRLLNGQWDDDELQYNQELDTIWMQTGKWISPAKEREEEEKTEDPETGRGRAKVGGRDASPPRSESLPYHSFFRIHPDSWQLQRGLHFLHQLDLFYERCSNQLRDTPGIELLQRSTEQRLIHHAIWLYFCEMIRSEHEFVRETEPASQRRFTIQFPVGHPELASLPEQQVNAIDPREIQAWPQILHLVLKTCLADVLDVQYEPARPSPVGRQTKPMEAASILAEQVETGLQFTEAPASAVFSFLEESRHRNQFFGAAATNPGQFCRFSVL